jgi:hypothetical protein
MIRLGKQVKLLEWGEGTTTMNQRWIEMAKGNLRAKPKIKAGVTVLTVEIEGSFNKQNEKDDWIKIAQPGEGMTPASDRWGEVGMGRLKAVELEGGKTIVHIELKTATKIGKGL